MSKVSINPRKVLPKIKATRTELASKIVAWHHAGMSTCQIIASSGVARATVNRLIATYKKSPAYFICDPILFNEAVKEAKEIMAENEHLNKMMETHIVAPVLPSIEETSGGCSVWLPEPASQNPQNNIAGDGGGAVQIKEEVDTEENALFSNYSLDTMETGSKMQYFEQEENCYEHEEAMNTSQKVDEVENPLFMGCSLDIKMEAEDEVNRSSSFSTNGESSLFLEENTEDDTEEGTKEVTADETASLKLKVNSINEGKVNYGHRITICIQKKQRYKKAMDAILCRKTPSLRETAAKFQVCNTTLGRMVRRQNLPLPCLEEFEFERNIRNNIKRLNSHNDKDKPSESSQHNSTLRSPQSSLLLIQPNISMELPKDTPTLTSETNSKFSYFMNYTWSKGVEHDLDDEAIEVKVEPSTIQYSKDSDFTNTSKDLINEYCNKILPYCPMCKCLFSSMEDKLVHWKAAHPREKMQVVCRFKKCGHSEMNASNMRNHVIQHLIASGKLLNCTKCKFPQLREMKEEHETRCNHGLRYGDSMRKTMPSSTKQPLILTKSRSILKVFKTDKMIAQNSTTQIKKESLSSGT